MSRSDDEAVGKQVAAIVEGDDAVAQKAPALLGVSANDAGCVPVFR
jgi:hypothetical protein